MTQHTSTPHTEPASDQTTPQPAAHPASTPMDPRATPYGGEPEYLTGPAPTPVIIGLVGLLALVSFLVWALSDWVVNWAVAVPAGIVGLGAVIVALGLAGLRRPRA